MTTLLDSIDRFPMFALHDDLAAELDTLAKQFDTDGDLDLVFKAMDLLEDRGRLDQVTPWLERLPEPYRETSAALVRQARHAVLCGDFAHALQLWQHVSALYPDCDLLGYHRIIALIGLYRYEEAYQLCKEGIEQLQAGAAVSECYRANYHGLWAQLQLRYVQAEGFRDYPEVLNDSCFSYQAAGVPMWSVGDNAIENLRDKHLLVTSIGGFGDQMLYASQLPLLKFFCRKITLITHRCLSPILEEALGGITVIADAAGGAHGIKAPLTPELLEQLAADMPDLQMTILHLPAFAAQFMPDGKPSFQPYVLRKPPLSESLAANIAARAQGRRRVGIAWETRQRWFPNDYGADTAYTSGRRSFPLEHINHFLHDEQLREKMHFCILHELNVERHWPNMDNANATQFDIELGNFLSTMGVMQSCDLIVTVDMSVANLAMMMGKETWLIINTESDWKWGVGGSTTPWFPHVRCFRQTEPGDWAPVAAELFSALLQAR